MSSAVNITVDLGDQEILEGTALDASGDPVPLDGVVGVELAVTVRKAVSDTLPALLEMNSTDDPTQVVILDTGSAPTIGTYRIIFLPADLLTLGSGYFTYSVTADFGSNNVQTLVVGTLTVNGSAHHG